VAQRGGAAARRRRASERASGRRVAIEQVGRSRSNRWTDAPRLIAGRPSAGKIVDLGARSTILLQDQRSCSKINDLGRRRVINDLARRRVINDHSRTLLIM